MIFKSAFFFELKKRLRKRDIIIFFIIAVIVLLIIQDGKNNYLNVLENRNIFQEAEATEVSKYVLYRQYGSFGIKLMFVPSPYSILFKDYAFDGLLSSINIAERLNIYKPVKGKSFFNERSGFMSFAGIILLFGILGSLLYGYDTIKNKDCLDFLCSITNSKKIFLAVIVSRIIILNLAFLLLLSIPILSLLLDNINLFQPPLFSIVLVLILEITFFSAVGGVIGTLKKSIRGIIFAAVYFLFAVFVPFLADKGDEINAAGIEPLFKFELDSIKIIRTIDKKLINKFGSLKSNEAVPKEIIKAVKDAVENEHEKIRERESRMKKYMLKKIKQRQKISALIPVIFPISVNREVSSNGGLSFIDFYSFGIQRKMEFIDFYVEKRFLGKNKPEKIGQVESFVKTDENLFYAKSHLPENFSLGIGLRFCYIFVFLIILYKIHIKETKEAIKKAQIDFKEGQNSIFVLCKDNQIKNEIFRYYEQQNAICLDKINTKDFRFYGIGLEYMFNYFCSISGVDKEIASENLALLGITDLKRESHEHDTILKIYAAIKITADSEFIVLNDFLKKESRKLEENVFELLTNLEMEGKKIIYLSTEMYYTKVSMDKKIKVENTVTFPLFMDKITVR